MILLRILCNRFFGQSRQSQNGAISLAETLIVLSIGVTILAVWAQNRVSQIEISNAQNAGRAIATYARASSTWLAQSPPASSGNYTVAQLQDCDDPTGPRFLSCSFSSETPIPYARSDTGDALTYGDLEIDVSITPAGSLGVIDFGVFRSGDDANDDGLPDSRPDLAAAAFQTALEQTGAGVMDFFELMFVEPDPAAVIFDPDDPNYDPDQVDDLARLQARVGALATGNAPFLRIDGGNEMTDGLNFQNGMEVNMSAAGLIVEGPGDVEVNTTTGDLLVAGQVEADSLQASSAEFDLLEVEPVDGVSGDGFEKFNQAPDVVRIDTDINRLTSRVTVNEQDIQANMRAIASNQQEIRRNFSDIFDLTGRVNVNTAAIASNRQQIDQNTQDILDNITNPIQSCTPTRATVLAQNPGSLSCGGTCHACGTWVGISSVHAYRSRNLSTLGCDDHTIRIYSTCCLNSNGLCDGWCENGATHC